MKPLDWLCVAPKTPLVEVLRRQAGSVEKGLPAGLALVVDEGGAVLGTITDGDARRAILRVGSLELAASEAMAKSPILFPDTFSYRDVLRALPGELQKRGRRSSRFLGKIVLVDAQNRPTRVLDYHEIWEQRVATHRHVVVVGMGYVGLTLALVLAEEGFAVTGVDVDGRKIDALRRGESHVHEHGLAELLGEQVAGSLAFATDLPEDGDVFVVAVGTPVEGRQPQLDDLVAAVEMVGRRLRRGGLVVLRSTVPVGTTRKVALPLLEKLAGLRGGLDFHLAFAPERTAEGKALEELRQLPQLIGGLNDDSVEATAALFRELTPMLVRAESLEAAELAKLLNNAYRDLIFAFANEMVGVASQHNIDLVEVIRAANRSYPRDPLPLPSPGVGGPCLTKDPYILAGARPDSLSEHGRRVNESMHERVAESVLAQLRALGKEPSRADVLICGLAFKGRPETGDLRNSSSLAIAALLRGRVRSLHGHDAVALATEIEAAGLQPAGLPQGFSGMDAVLFLNNHPAYEKTDVLAMARALRSPGIVYDAWHMFHADEILRTGPCVFMGLGFSRSSVAP